MQLTRNFHLREFTATSTGLPNVPNNSHKDNIKFVATKLQYIRDNICLPITIDSGFRTVAVNNRVRGSNTSLHLSGLAVDILIDNIDYKLMPKFLDLVLDTKPYEIHFNSHRIMHISWLKDDLSDIINF